MHLYGHAGCSFNTPPASRRASADSTNTYYRSAISPLSNVSETLRVFGCRRRRNHGLDFFRPRARGRDLAQAQKDQRGRRTRRRSLWTCARTRELRLGVGLSGPARKGREVARLAGLQAPARGLQLAGYLQVGKRRLETGQGLCKSLGGTGRPVRTKTSLS